MRLSGESHQNHIKLGMRIFMSCYIAWFLLPLYDGGGWAQPLCRRAFTILTHGSVLPKCTYGKPVSSHFERFVSEPTISCLDIEIIPTNQ